jgi:hypothetical protein
LRGAKLEKQSINFFSFDALSLNSTELVEAAGDKRNDFRYCLVMAARPPLPLGPSDEARPGITAYLEGGGTLESAQLMAAHESPRTTKLYDRTGDEITLDEVERITI